MVFLALVMMPFYYITKAHSVPSHLRLRYNEATRGLNGISFLFMTVMMSGINMYATAIVMKVVFGWNIHFSNSPRYTNSSLERKMGQASRTAATGQMPNCRYLTICY